jgi:hypothetical protein
VPILVCNPGETVRKFSADFIRPIGETVKLSDTGLCGSVVGGIAELPDVSGSSGPPYTVLAGGVATALLALTAGAWYARRRCHR